jgi:DNA polymerase III delta subunit
MTFQSVNIKTSNEQHDLNKVEKMLSTDPFFANNNMMMICDSDEEFDEDNQENPEKDLKRSPTDSVNCLI